ncbi:MAG: hypothetical protein JST75_13390 [Bacteroidetes bacterium]|nr:hypothetical protein [Bacteroidota bacterium]
MALQILNLSFSNLAMQESSSPNSGAENNQIDSAIEYITEDLLGWNNFIPEQHKAHQDKHFVKGAAQPLFCERISPPVHISINKNNKTCCEFISSILSEYHVEINPPPPKTECMV